MAKTKNGIYYPDDYSLVADVPGDMKETAESVDKVIDDYKKEQTSQNTEITKLKKENTTNKEDISNIKKEQAAQDQKIDTLEKENTSLKQEIKQQYYTKEEIEKVIDKKEVEGTEIHIEDAKEFNMIELSVEGKSEQKSRSGKNKFDLSKVISSSMYDITETGVNLKNVWGGDFYSNDNTIKTFKPNTTYTMKAKIKVVSRPSTQVHSQNDLLALYRPASNALGGAFVSCLQMNDKYSITLNTEKTYITTFTTPADITDVRFIAYSFYGNDDGSDTGTASGEIDLSEIMLVEGTYTAENFPDFELYGASPSSKFPSPIENVEGWNKFDKNSVTNGYYLNESGNLIASANYCVSDFIKVEEGEKYFIPKRNTSRTKYYLSDKTAYSNTWDVSDYAQVITIPVGVKYIRFSILILGNDAVDLNTFQFIKGSEEKPYAPFNSLVIEDVGKNEFDEESILGTYYSKNSEGYYEITSSYDLYSKYNEDNGGFPVKFRENAQYTFSLKIKAEEVTVTDSYIFYFLYTDGTTSMISGEGIDIKNLKITSTKEKSVSMLYFSYGNRAKLYMKDLQLEENVEATDYEPYKSQVATFPLAEGQKLMQGSYLSDTGIHHTRKQVVFDGSSDEIIEFSEIIGNTVRFVIKGLENPKKNSGSSACCSHFENIFDYAIDKEHFYFTNAGLLYFYISKDTASTLTEFKQWLSENPITVEYELAEPVTEPFSAEQQTAWNNVKAMKLFEGVNNITVNATIKPNIRFKYAQDLKKRIEKIEQAIVAIGGVE